MDNTKDVHVHNIKRMFTGSSQKQKKEKSARQQKKGRVKGDQRGTLSSLTIVPLLTPP
jgi:hypothetical protein